MARAVEGQGVMSEALRAVMAWGWSEMGLNRIEAQVHPDHSRSINLLSRLGFVHEGRLRQAAYWNGAFQDMHLYAVLRQDATRVLATGVP